MFEDAAGRLTALRPEGGLDLGPVRARPSLPGAPWALLCRIMLAIEIALFGFFVAGTHGLIVPLEKPATTDLVSFYAAGVLADAGTPFLAYDQSAHRAVEQAVREPGIGYVCFYYPPIFLLICAVVALLPYIPAFLLFEAAGLAAYVFVLSRIAAQPVRRVLVPTLAFPPVLWTIGFGQNGFLTAALFGGATLIVDRRPVVAGMLFAALSFKPHFALLVPVALVAGGYWRCLAATAAAGVALGLLSLAVFGAETWHAFLMAAAASGAVYGAGQVPFTGFITPFAAARLLGAGLDRALVIQAAVSLIAAGFVAVVWRRRPPLGLRAASLVATSLIAVPVALFYDLVVAGVAGAWLLRSRQSDRWPAPVLPVLALLYVLCLNPRGVAAAARVPLGLIVVLGLSLLTAAMVMWRRRSPPEGAGSGGSPAAVLPGPVCGAGGRDQPPRGGRPRYCCSRVERNPGSPCAS